MQKHGYMLAEMPGFGRIFDCGACGCLHLSVGPVSLTLTTEAYMQLVALLNSSAANFELWIQNQKQAPPLLEEEQDGRCMDDGL